MQELIKGTDAYNEALNKFTECYKTCLGKDAISVHQILYSILGYRAGMDLEPIDFIMRGMLLTEHQENRALQLIHKIETNLLKNGFANCLEFIGEKHTSNEMFDAESDVIDTTYDGGQYYAKAGNQVYKLNVDHNDYEEAFLKVIFEDIGKLHILDYIE
jgi:hypothetical protein